MRNRHYFVLAVHSLIIRCLKKRFGALTLLTTLSAVCALWAGGTLAASGKPDREGEETMEKKSTTVNSKGNGRGGRLERDWKIRAPLLQIPLKIWRVCIAKQTQHVFWRRYSNSIIRRRYGGNCMYIMHCKHVSLMIVYR